MSEVVGKKAVTEQLHTETAKRGIVDSAIESLKEKHERVPPELDPQAHEKDASISVPVNQVEQLHQAKNATGNSGIPAVEEKKDEAIGGMVKPAGTSS